MTRMSAPFKIKRALDGSDTSVMSVDVSGSAKFAQGASFGAAVVVAGGITVSGGAVEVGATVKATRMQVGTSAADSADVLLCRQIAVPSNTTKTAVRLPDGSDIVDVTMFIQTPPGGTAQSTVNVLVGTTAQDNRFASFTNVSAQGHHKVSTRQTSAWNSVSGASGIITVHTSAVSGAIASGASGRVNIFYVKRQ